MNFKIVSTVPYELFMTETCPIDTDSALRGENFVLFDSVSF